MKYPKGCTALNYTEEFNKKKAFQVRLEQLIFLHKLNYNTQDSCLIKGPLK